MHKFAKECKKIEKEVQEYENGLMLETSTDLSKPPG
jgi:hypothetical protein